MAPIEASTFLDRASKQHPLQNSYEQELEVAQKPDISHVASGIKLRLTLQDK
jgi:hypothetical protein